MNITSFKQYCLYCQQNRKFKFKNLYFNNFYSAKYNYKSFNCDNCSLKFSFILDNKNGFQIYKDRFFDDKKISIYTKTISGKSCGCFISLDERLIEIDPNDFEKYLIKLKNDPYDILVLFCFI